jgi:hypothetical protein
MFIYYVVSYKKIFVRETEYIHKIDYYFRKFLFYFGFFTFYFLKNYFLFNRSHIRKIIILIKF